MYKQNHIFSFLKQREEILFNYKIAVGDRSYRFRVNRVEGRVGATDSRIGRLLEKREKLII